MKRKTQSIIAIILMLLVMAIIYIMSPSGVRAKPISSETLRLQLKQQHSYG